MPIWQLNAGETPSAQRYLAHTLLSHVTWSFLGIVTKQDSQGEVGWKGWWAERGGHGARVRKTSGERKCPLHKLRRVPEVREVTEVTGGDRGEEADGR